MDIVQYLLSEVKSNRLSQEIAVDMFGQLSGAVLSESPASLHPLLQRNTSDLKEQRFSSTFSGDEFYLNDHVVNGSKVLPGVAFLEMARAAVERSAGLAAGAGLVVTLQNVVWVRPVIVSGVREVHIGLYAQENGEIEFEIYSTGQEATDGEVIHAQGRAVLLAAAATEGADSIDLSPLRSQCDQSIDVAQCYAAFSAMGIEYGPAHRGLTSVQMGIDTDGQRFVLAQVTLPECVNDPQEQYVLHPSVVDSALQASIGLSLANASLSEGVTKAVLPFALEQIHILDRSPTVAMVVVRACKTSSAEPTINSIQKLDIVLCDASGRVCVRFQGFTSRVLETDLSSSRGVIQSDVSQVMVLAPSIVGVSQGEFHDKTLLYLKKLLSDALKLPANRIESDVGFEQYGIDSILALKLVNELELTFGSLPKTLLFEYQSIDALAGYFIEHHRDALSVQLKLTERAVVTPRVSPSVAAKTAVATSGEGKRRRGRFSPLALHDQHPTHAQADGAIDIAIVGMSGRYPGANNVDEFWENLKASKDCITEIPASRWDYRDYFDAEKGKFGKSYSKWGGFIEGVDQFDSLFFNISPREAQFMDPQERLFLQCVYQTLEDAGYTRDALKSNRATGLDGNVGVFVGVMYEEYQLYGAQAQTLGQPIALGGNPSSIANRVSYFCNFHGPSMAVDTMCSSSLTAIHLACESIKHHGCEVAIAGGVNVSIHPNKYLGLSQGQFASSTGRCESFGEGGDGYVPGEGVGAVLLKPLSKAIADHDHIYGVIKGTAINHGGKTNGYTVPNPQAQAQVIAQALKESKIDPRTISYIEAHGTGTSLGDPIEIAGLTKAFGEYTQEKQYCAIGSAKSNIGHLESAAGIAALTKVLLQMQHQTLVPSLHSQTLNPHIDFTRTPFNVQQSLAEWKRPTIDRDGVQREYPRIAGISSFGAGGANAHVIIEEYCTPQDAPHAIEITPEHPALIILSAKSEDRLQEQVKQLLAYVSTHPLSETDLARLAYTLQVGREAMEQRLAFTAITMEELQQKLTACEAGKLEQGAIEECYRGEVKKNKEAVSMFTGDEELQESVAKWIQRGKYAKLIELWTKGLSFDWQQLYSADKPQRITLPTYPFAQERYWIEASSQASVQSGVSRALHPLLQQNTSDLDEQRYSSTFSGAEFYLSDHVVSGNKILPGVCYLEMARAAVQFGVRQGDGQGGVTLQNIVWQRPVIVRDEQAIHIGLNRTDGGEIEFEIYSTGLDATSDEVIHAQGRAVLLAAGSAAEAEPMDLSLLRSQCGQSIEIAQCYAAFSAMGLTYGPAHRGLTSVQVGTDTNGQRFVLAQVTLPACVSDTQDQYVLHPSVLDSALQASIGVSLDQLTGASSAGELTPSLPFALERLQIFDRSPSTAWVVVRPQSAVGSIQKLDIEIGDEAGRVCVRLQGFTSRVLDSEVNRDHREPLDRGLVLAAPSWQPKPLTAESATSAKEKGERYVVMESIYKERLPELQAQYPAVNWTVLPEASEDRPLLASAQQLFTQVQSILHSKPMQVLVQVVVAEDAKQPTFTSVLSGLLKSAHQENPKFLGQMVMLRDNATKEEIARAVEENASQQSVNDVEIRYVDGVREEKVFKELSEHVTAISSRPWKEGGVYLITGGAGGLGLIMAEEIASQVEHATLVLTGRSSLSAAKQTQLEVLKQRHAGTHIHYRVLDVSDADAVTNCIDAIVEQYGSLNGVIHSAGVIKDNFIIKKSVAELQSVLAPKVSGTLNLDRATQSMELDCFILFSSTSGVLGNIGQSDYAMANAFMDRYAAYRNELVGKKERHGRALSINWPLWESGGMQVDVTTVEQMRRHGLDVLSTALGIEAVYRAWASNESQVMVLAGDRQTLKQVVGLAVPLNAVAARKEVPVVEEAIDGRVGISHTELIDKTQQYLKKLLASALKMTPDRLESDVGFEQYGIDSILALKLVNELELTFGSLPKTLLFEYQSIDALTGYFIEHHRDMLNTQLKLTERAPIAARTSTSVAIKSTPTVSSINKRRRGRMTTQRTDAVQISGEQANNVADIAIVGMSGRYPGANNVDEFWENLKASKDCITEIPASRWDYRDYFDAEKGKFGKSYSKWGGFIEGVDEFDPLFFNISPLEAQITDPQERLFLQCVYQTLEDAGYTRDALKSNRATGLDGNVGVFVGVMYEEYQLYGAQAQTLGQPIALGGNPSSIANRVSYFCNFHGPSMAVDTMCSSSLTAIHLACESIKHHGCEVAIAGGVNVSIHPNKYLGLSQGQFASSTGRCESFGEGGDGYVPGEGVGAVLLKPLSKAIADHDHIYGVIKGTAINHGGKTNGYTVPNPQAQAQVIAQALKESKIDPRTISYIEAHGTGTSLGDPIEIAGLTKAFGEYTQEKQYCAIGSAKSNIGHLESAAGIAALTKVLLQMQHQTFVPSLHSATLNPYIDFTRTPFVVQQELAGWARPVIEIDGRSKECPRIAGISSFGAGGANAHVIIEEYEARAHLSPSITSDRPALIVLSAKNEAQLKERVDQLLAHLSTHALADADLVNLAYTLQVGREAMEQRLAFTTTTIKELQEKLTAYSDGKLEKGEMEECYRGEVKKNKETLSIFNADDALQQAIAAWVVQGKYTKLLELWVKGLAFEWTQLYGEATPHRISLPTYPFTRESYWIETGAHQVVGRSANNLHPLLHLNTSSLGEQRFSSIFSGDEFFLSDHQVKGNRVLPGVCYLEIARAALVASLDNDTSTPVVMEFKNVVWMQPVLVTESQEVRIALVSGDHDEIEFEIYSAGEGTTREEVVHAQGRAVLLATGSAEAAEPIDLSRLHSQSTQSIAATEIYAAFSAMGIEYGPAHRGLASVQVGADIDGQRFVLAQVKLPECVSDTHDQYVLHPSVLDSALQASIGLSLANDSMNEGVTKAALPFALEQLQIFDRSPAEARVVVRACKSLSTTRTAANIQKLDIDVCDEAGRVCVRLRGFTSRVLETNPSSPRASHQALDKAPTPIATTEVVIETSQVDVDTASLLEKVQRALTQLISQQLKVKADDIDVESELSEFGFDSISLTAFGNTLNHVYGFELSPTIFFEYPTVQRFAEYLVQEHTALLASRFAVRATDAIKTKRALPLSVNAPKRLRSSESLTRRGRLLGAVVAHGRAQAGHEPIAIIGMSGCFPGARDVDAFWENLKSGKDSITEIPKSRWDWQAMYGDPTIDANKTNIKWGGFIDGVGEFDPLFFNISPKEAELMDPPQRLLMTHTWQAIEDAGYAASSLSGSKTGIFVGTSSSGYGELIAQANMPIEGYSSTGAVASIGPNRMSYLLNLHGPSEPIETACSSSLVAIHRAVRAMQAGDCEQALVGGINTIITPWAHISFSKAGMLSEDGRCKTFSKEANGYVRGEGAGMLFLKKLSAAERDGDHIYGLIKGSSENHGGRANSLTAPNPKAQAALLKAAYREAKIDPRTVSYIETHGTGTPLGDPVEINGLKSAFAELYSEHANSEETEAHCGLGSVKTNIGHLELAAGVAGVIKVLLQLKHKTLAKSLHCEALNPYIQIQGSPFYVVNETQPWAVSKDSSGRAQPRRAGVSSFGFGGVNAHVIIEEYCVPQLEEAMIAITPEHPALIVLSAKTEDRLQEQVKQLLWHVSTHALSDTDLARIAYTLQVGREAMEHRLALTTTSIKELQAKLRGYLEGKVEKEEIEECHVGQVKREKGTLSLFTADEELQEAINKWVQRGKYGKLLELWVKGLAFEWTQLYGEATPHRISLPTYPFTRESYWIETGAHQVVGRSANNLHPLLHLNTSSLGEQRFSSIFSGDEFFLSDHQVKGNRVLPGVCYLEIARAALVASLDNDTSTPVVMEFKNVVWMQPVLVTESQEVRIALVSGDHDEIEFEIYSAGEGTTREEVVHAQGRAVLLATGSAEAAEPIDLSRLHSQSTQSIAATEIYAAFSAMGIEYGPAHRGLASVQVGTDIDGQRFVLAQVKLPECVSDTHDQYVLHPSVLDSALQASIGLSLANDSMNEGVTKAALPFALEQLQIFDRSPAEARVVVRACKSLSTTPTATNIQKLDIDVCDEAGRVCVRLRGFTSRVLETDPSSPRGVMQGGVMQGGVMQSDVMQADRTLLLMPHWESSPLLADAMATPVEYGERWIFIDAIYQECLPELQSQSPALQWSVLAEFDEGTTAERLMAAGEQVFARVQSLLQSRPKHSVLLQVLLGVEVEHHKMARALSGLLKSAHQENPKFIGQVLTLSHSATVAALAHAVNENAGAAAKHDAEIRYVAGERQVTRFQELSESVAATQSPLPWKGGGVYLITGGGGGLGLIVAREIVSRVNAARIILTGRSALSAAKQAQLDVLNQGISGAHVEYRVLDVSDAAAVTRCVHSVVEHYGSLNGIVHSAGVIKDNFIIKKTHEEFRSVLAPKVTGTVNLDQATQDVDLDFLILFSSMTGAFGNVGQSDYALANAFMDCYAAYRNRLVEKNERHGRTLSINWPLWESGGMQVNAATLTAMRRQGLDVLTTADGIDALYRAWRSDASQVMVLTGDRQMLRSLVGLASEAAKVPHHTLDRAPAPIATTEVVIETSQVDVDTASLLEKVQRALTQLISQQLKVKADDIDVESELSEFGFDSISLTAFGNTLNHVYGFELSPTIFFEYPTVQRFAEYLVQEHTALLASRFAVRATDAIKTKRALPLSVNAPKRLRSSESLTRRGRLLGAVVAHGRAQAGHEPIAIIGMSGCFPGARDVDAFWENLKSGKDSITEIPKSRWDWQAMYGDPTIDANKTNIKWGGFIDGVGEFDPLFFNISPKEAELMDPPQRLLMTHTWQAIEDAGYAASSLSGSKTGIFVGTSSSGYGELIAQANMPIEGYSSTGAVASIGPNRMSYLLNLHGPSEPIETACSSSLVAIHRAVRAMQAGDCEQALVGGINTIITPWAHISFSKAGMLSEDGRCKTFSKEANGYVRGEGAGMLFLKKLSAAERDGDHIYGLIKGSSENHGGRANSLTAPNPKAQAALLKAAYREAKIDPRTVSYIETHGTGTPLGDPVEINGLKSAFAELYSEHANSEETEAHCGLGSVKTNIGHLELAAGVAGVIKVLLQLKHKTLAKSLHCEALNPYIQIQGSPFYVVNETQPWAVSKDSSGRAQPRRAGVSSFGFGGVNAHVIIEEYCVPQLEEAMIAITPEHPALIVLSAKTEDRLQEQVKQLLWHVSTHALSDTDLARIAYTLQVGREAMEHRLALTTTSIKELQAKLRGYLEGKVEKEEIEECHVGQVKREKGTLSLFTADEELQEAINKWVQRGKYGKLLELWVKGLAFEWTQLYGEATPHRISLPTYPFTRESYWIETGAHQVVGRSANNLHPLLHLNTSSLGEQRFSSIFSGDEFFLSDHQVKGNRVLPGVCYLEIARAALVASLDNDTSTPVVMEFKNVVWMQPVLVTESQEVRIALVSGDHDEIEFEIYSAGEGTTREEVVHAQGRAVLLATGSAEAAEPIDLSRLHSQSTQSIAATEIYAAFSAMGIEYGPAHRGLASVQVGTDIDGQRFVLAQVKLPECVSDTHDQYVLHPSVLDSALQASIGLSLANDSMNEGVTKAALPFALEQLQIFDRSPVEARVVVRACKSLSTTPTAANIQKLDIDVCDEAGRVCVRLRGFTSRVLETDPSSPRASHQALDKAPTPIATTEVVIETSQVDVDTASLLEKVQRALTQLISQQLKVKADDIDVESELSEFGFDSISLTAFGNTLNHVYGFELSPTIFFEYPTVQRFAEYLVQEHTALLASRFAVRATDAIKTKRALPLSVNAPKRLRSSESLTRRGRLLGAVVAHGRAQAGHEPIAIIGMSGCFPGARDVDAFWENLKSGKDSIAEIPSERWSLSGFYETEKGKANAAGTSYCKWGGFIDDVDHFDPLFFNIAPRAAEFMDPQELLFLETVWTLMESSGYTREILTQRHHGKVGVYAGSMYHHQPFYDADVAKASANFVNSHSSIANRVSHFFGLNGPSMAIDTMCSSAAMAVHLACQDLQLGVCEMAVAGGVNLSIHPNKYVGLSQAQLLGSHFGSRSFAVGDGYHPAEGVGTVLLKPLASAIEGRDTILAVIKSTAINHSGRGNGYAVPNPNAQAELIEEACRKAGVDARTISYVEAAANGSELGDAIEVVALTKAFEKFTGDRTFCALGSVKASIGHAEAASAMSQLAKVVLQLKHELLVPTLKPQILNPNLHLEKSPFYLQDKYEKWNRPMIVTDSGDRELPRRAIINSFGAGGTNVTLLVEEYCASVESGSIRVPVESGARIVVVSARTSEQLVVRLQQLREYLGRNKVTSLLDLTYTLLFGREAMDVRWAMVANTIQDLIEGLDTYLATSSHSETVDASLPVFLGDIKQPSEIGRFLSQNAQRTLVEAMSQDGNYQRIAMLWTKGVMFQWSDVFETSNCNILPIPTYPFARLNVRNVQKGARSRTPGIHADGIALSKIVNLPGSGAVSIRARLSAKLGIPESELSDATKLSEIGINSVEAVNLRGELENELRCEIPLSIFSSTRTLTDVEWALQRLVTTRESLDQHEADIERTQGEVGRPLGNVTAAFPVIDDNKSDRYEPFPLTDIQQAFLVGGRLGALGNGISARIYFEVELPTLDIYRLNQSWARLISHHDMLRAVVLSDGRQQILKDAGPYRIMVADLRRLGNEERVAELETTRERLLRRVCDEKKWPLFDVRISVCPDSFVLHFTIEELIIDGSGLALLLRQWQQLYSDPAFVLTPLTLSYRDYVLALKDYDQTKRYQRDLEYWISKLDRPLPGPKVPSRSNVRAATGITDYVRLFGTLPPTEWALLKQRTKQLGVSPTILLLTLFSEVLRAWSERKSFSLVMTYFNRLPVHPQIEEVLGPFISTAIFSVQESDQRSLTELLRDNEQQVWSDLDHSRVSGVRILRELKSRGKLPGSFSLPVVFTSLLNNLGAAQSVADSGEKIFEEFRYFLNKTPQVYLDHQVTETASRLEFSWDVSRAYFGGSTIDAIFEAYCDVLHELSNSDADWSAEGVSRVIEARKVEGLERLERNELQASADCLCFGRPMPVEGLALISTPAEKFEPYPLTDQQQAYAFGRGKYLPGGGNSCQYYQEIDVQHLDVVRLNRAWHCVLEKHAMLVTKIFANGTQQRMEVVPPFHIEVLDIQRQTEFEQTEVLAQVKRSMIERVCALGDWPYFDLRVSRVTDRSARIHFSIDMLIADGRSIRLVLQDLLAFYTDPVKSAVKDAITFRDYVIALRRYRETPEYQLDLTYWETKFATLPGGPMLPQCEGTVADAPKERQQLSGRLLNWSAVKETATRLDVMPNAVLLTAYMEVLSAWNRGRPFSVVIPRWQRLSLHPDIDQIVGDFTALSWVVSCDLKELCFSDKVRCYHEAMQEDLAHQAVSGLTALRKILSKRRGNAPTFPIVFTDLLPSMGDETMPDGFEFGSTVSQTPQVSIDNISSETGGLLDFHWDVRVGVYPVGMVEAMFAGYCRVLQFLADHPDDWQGHSVAELIGATPERYAVRHRAAAQELV